MRVQQFDYTVDLTQAILWQYNNATNLLSLIDQKQTWYNVNQTAFWQNWYTNVFNLLTANAFGLAVWSYILNVPLYFENPPDPMDKPLWGFNLYNPSYPTLENTYFNFGGVAGNAGGNFSTKGGTISLTEEEQRFLLRLRYFQLYTRGNVQADPITGVTLPSANVPGAPISGINNFLHYLVNSSDIGYTGQIYVLDGLNMTMTYVFTTPDFPQYLLDAMIVLDILPRPAGVGILIHTEYGKQFGFNAFDPSYPDYENTNQNFGNGNFLAPYTT